MLYYTVPSIVKKDIKSSGLHYGWHLQMKLIFYTQQITNHKTKIQYAQTTTKQLSQGRLLVKEIRTIQLVAVKREKILQRMVYPSNPPQQSGTKTRETEKSTNTKMEELGIGNCCCWFDIWRKCTNIKTIEVLQISNRTSEVRNFILKKPDIQLKIDSEIF